MSVSLEKHIRDLAVLASMESEDDVSEALLLIVRGSRLPRALRRGFVSAVAGLLESAEILSERYSSTADESELTVPWPGTSVFTRM